jgi:hypothetical protein
VIRKAVTNLVTYSEEFDNTAWNSAAGQRTVNPNQIAAPDGSFTADLVTADGTNAPHFVSQAVTLTATPYTFSVFAKAGTNNFLQIRFFVAFGDRYANFDLANGTVGSSNNITAASIVPVGDGWYRCIVIATPTAASSSVGIYLVSSDTSPSSETNTLSTNLYLWGAQLEESSTVGQYVKTTTAKNGAPRFDHDPTTGESLGLLVEESRQNLLTYSEEFDDAAWTQAFLNEQITANSATAPNGLQTADTITTVSGTTGEFGVGQSATITSNVACTYSIFAKSSASNFIYVRYYGTSNFFYTAIIDLSSGIVTKTAIGSSTTNASASVVAAGNGWYRISLTATHPGRTTVICIVGPAPSSTAEIGSTFGQVFFTGSANQSVLIWGAQLEAGSFPTSYIPTEGSIVTRAADVASITGTNFSSWYNQSEGTIFADSQTPYPVASGKFPTMLSITDGTTTNNNFSVGFLTENLSSALVENNNIHAIPDYMSPLSGVRRRKISLAAADNDAFGVTNGTLTSPKVNDILLPRNHAEAIIGGNLSYNAMNGTVRRLTYWPTRLSNDTLQTITT